MCVKILVHPSAGQKVTGHQRRIKGREAWLTLNGVRHLHASNTLPSANCCNSEWRARLHPALLADVGRRSGAHYQDPDPDSAKDHRIRRIFISRCRPVRGDHRHRDRRGQSEQSAKCGDHRHQARAGKRERQRRLSAQFLHPEALDLSKGNHKMMYEPPNRGGKTYQTLNNTPNGDE